jgi:anthranilate/para-aminobenzoate synthase component II
MPVGRYHSLAAIRVPPDLEVAAEGEGVVMAVRHRTAPAVGIQFHPESVLTPGGGRLIDNLIRWATDASR